MKRRATVLLALSLACGFVSGAARGAAPARRVLVVCSPGSPGTTAQAQPTLDQFATAVESAAKLPAGSFGAVYHETAEAGVPRLAQSDAVLALVPLPFLLQYGAKLGLEAKLQALPESAATEVWSLAAHKGALTSPASLAGWEITGTAGYASDFVRKVALSRWGVLPVDVKVTFTPRPLAALRRAAAGEKVAVLLDRSQEAALASLPFAADLEVVGRSEELPSGYLCGIGKRLSATELDSFTRTLLHLNESEAGLAALKGMRMTKFVEADLRALESIRKRTAAPQGAGS